ncbi:MAG: hypothetical protein Q8P95_03730 [bacterium]|nr:hypothetical protein [bacterium]
MKPQRSSSLTNLVTSPTTLLAIIGVGFLFFDAQYWMMLSLPGIRDDMCVVGAALTPFNIGFAIVQSMLAALVVVGLVASLNATRPSLKVASISGAGAILGSVSIFCLACTIPIISLFGLTASLNFFTDYNVWIKVSSLILLVIGLHQLDKQLRGECERCAK